MQVNVELLVNPFCMADRDNETVKAICTKLGVNYRLFNIWEIDDEMDGIPDHMSILVKEYRNGTRPGNIYSNVFVNGQRLLLDKWPKHLEMTENMIKKALEG